MSSPVNTRRWPRHPVELPVLVCPRGADPKFMVQGRGIEMSEGGMTLYAGLPLQPGELMDIEFQTPGRKRISAVVRSRMGYCFGLEFLTPLGSDSTPTPPVNSDVRSMLRRKEIEMDRLRKEIATLRTFGKSRP